jgi:hypothetical protein
MGADMDGFMDFEVSFLDDGGAPVQTMMIAAETLTIATSRATEIASEIDASDFYITSKPAYPQRTAPSSP